MLKIYISNPVIPGIYVDELLGLLLHIFDKGVTKNYIRAMNIKVVKDNINIEELTNLSKETYYPMIKGVVDIENEIIAFGGEYHMDANNVLLEQGYTQNNIWGFNVYLDKINDKENWIEYMSLINIRPLQNNLDMEIQNQEIRDSVKNIVNKKIK